MLVLVDDNANCPEGGSWRFNALEPPRPVTAVRLYHDSDRGEWYDVVGWGLDDATPVCEATVRKIDDSGAGVAYLIVGGDGGVRLRPRDSTERWSLQNVTQWGAPYLVVPSTRDVVVLE